MRSLSSAAPVPDLKRSSRIVYLHISALRPADIQNDLAVIHHQRPIAESECGAHLMRYHQACQLLLGRDARSHGQNFLCRTRIERYRVLVEQKKLGLCYRCHQERQRLALTAGQKPHRLPQAVFQPHIQLAQLFAEIFAVTAAGAPPASRRVRRQAPDFLRSSCPARCRASDPDDRQADDFGAPVLRPERSTFWPSSRISPLSVRKFPPIAPNSVDFPAPFAPMMVIKSPSGTLSDRSCRAHFSLTVPGLKVLEILFSSSMRLSPPFSASGAG